MLSGISELVLPPPPDADPLHFDIYQNYEVECDQRDLLRAHLDTNGVKTIIQWGGKMIHQFADLRLNNDVPMAERLSGRYFLLPMNTSLSDEDVNYVGQQIIRYFD